MPPDTSRQNGTQSLVSGALATRVFLCFAAAYLLSYAFRSINAVIAPALLEDLGLSNADLGLLSSAYFMSFASLQLPLGIWLDKYGARRTESALLLVAAIGAVTFAISDSLAGLWIGRALIGAGVSACLMAPFKAYRHWYAPERQSQLASWMLVAGTSGALAATIPVTAAMPLIGWRGVFWLMAGLILLAAAAIFFLLKEVEVVVEQKTRAASSNSEKIPPPQRGYSQIFGDPYFRRMALLAMVNQGTFIALQTLWAGPWMITVLGMSKTETAQILFVVNLGLMLAFVGLGWWAPRHVARKGKSGWPVLRVVAIGLLGTVIAQALMLAMSGPWSWLLWVALAVFIPVTTLAQTEVSLAFPSALAGRANSAYNLMLFIGAFVVQWGVGLLIDVFEKQGASAPTAIRLAFGVCLALQVAALIAFVLNRAQPDPSLTAR